MRRVGSACGVLGWLLVSAAGLAGWPMTAYWGLLEVGQPREGETVFVSGAARLDRDHCPVLMRIACPAHGIRYNHRKCSATLAG